MSAIRKTLYGLAATIAAAAFLGGCSATMPAQSDDIVAKISRDSAGG